MPSPLVGTAARTGSAAAGGVIAGPLGAIAGSLIGGALFGFGGGPDVEGPRLDDFEVGSSAYGRAVPRGYGLARVAGTIIWATELEEDKDVDKVGGGLFGGGQKVTTYRYFANLAVAFGEGPAKAITRLWAGDKLLWDKGEEPDALAGGIPVGASVKHLLALRSMRVRVYRGTEDQEPDPFIAAKVLEETGEANATPAHRGLVCVVLEHMPLEDFGNRIPPITAEVNWLGQDEQPVRDLEKLPDSTSDTSNVLVPDWARWRAYARDGGRWVRINLAAMTEEFRSASTLDSNGDGITPTVVLPSGIVVANRSQRRYLVDPHSLHVLDEATEDFDSAINPLHNKGAAFTVTDIYGVTREFYADVQVISALTIVEVVHVAGEVKFARFLPRRGPGFPAGGGNVAFVAGGRERIGNSDVWFASEGSGGVISFIRYNVPAVARLDPFDEGDTEPVGVTRHDASLPASEVHPDATSISGDNMVYVRDLDGLAILASTDVGDFWVLLDRDGNLVRSVAVPTNISPGAHGSFHKSRVLGTEVVFGSGGRVVGADLATGTITLDQSGWDSSTQLGLTVYDSASDSLFNGGGGRRLHRLFLRRSSNSVPLSTVVTDLCTASGLDGSELDVAELADQVHGFVLAKQTSYRKALELLAATYLFDVIESDFKLAFKKRGRPVTRVIHEDDLVPVGDDGERWIEERAQDVELPLRFSVVYRDLERDSDRGVQSVQRVSNPDATMRSRNEASLELPLTLSPAAAKGVAQSLMFSAWIERVRQQLATAWTHVDLDPADVIQLQRKSGELQTLRVERLEIGANLEIRLETVVEEASSYTHAALTDGGRLYRRFELPGSAESRLALMDMPLVRDEHDAGRVAIQLYWSAGSDGIGNWPGGELFLSDDGVALSFVDEQLVGMDWGVLLEDVGDTALPFQTDNVNMIQVFMRQGTLSSVTELEMLRGQNLAALLEANGEIELVNFRDATPDPDVPGRYTLSRLLRGRRGTENFTGGHVAGGLFVPIESATLQQHVLPLAALDATRYWKFLGRGMRPGEAPLISRTVEARALKPYAPVQHKASGGPLGSADITLSWERRSRILGELVDGTGTVPLAEDSEAYELEILPQADGPVIRTVTGLAAKSYVYALADQQADFEDFNPDPGVENPGAEAGDLAGWTLGDTGAWEAAGPGGSRFGNIDPRTGNLFFWPAGGSPELGQRVDVSGWSKAIDLGNAEARLTAWTAADRSGSDSSRVKMTFLDENLSSLGSVTPGLTDPAGTGVWEEITAQGAIPVGTRYVDIFIEAIADSVNAETGFDDVILEIKPGLLPEIAFAVYQVSAQVGRGFRGVATVEVLP